MAIFSAIVTDVIKLGPSTYPLPDDALRVIVTPVRLSAPEPNPEYDFYDLIVQVWNGVHAADIHPSALDVRVEIEGGQAFDYWPETRAFSDRTSNLESPCNSTLEVPAGELLVNSDRNSSSHPASHTWRVRGESTGRFVPIFEQKAEFCLHRIQLPEGSGLRSLTQATLTWSYRGSLQVYPIADRTVAVEAIKPSGRPST
jgi:hypothetical protein